MEKIKEEEALLTVKEAAEFLRASQSTVYRMIKRGDLKAHKVGKKWLFYKKDLKEFVERNAYRPEASSLRPSLWLCSGQGSV